MKKLCFIVAVLIVFVLGLTTLVSANPPTLPTQAQAYLHSHIHQTRQPEVINETCVDDEIEEETIESDTIIFGTLGIAIPPVEF